MSQVTLQVHGLDCAEEVALLRQQLSPMPGVHELTFDILRGRMTVAFDASVTSTPSLINAVSKTGLRADECAVDAAAQSRAPSSDRRRRVLLTTVSGVLMLLGLIVQISMSGWSAATGAERVATPAAAKVLDLIAAACGLWLVLPKAALAVRRLRPDMNLLMTIATVGAFLIGEDSEAATVAFLFSLSLALESWSIDRARRAIESLMALTPAVACRIGRDNREEVVAAGEIAIGSAILVRPGERFPLDGQIVKGETTVNQAPITGESIPVAKRAGSSVLAGSINQEGTVEVITTKFASDSVMARILRLVTDAQRKRTATEQWVETFARYYTPAVLALAIAVMLAPPLLLGANWSHWFYQGLVLLVIACPCALVISTPVSIVAALTTAARQGVLVKGGQYLELAARMKAIAFDKTGTLTFGKPEVKQVLPYAGHSEHELLAIASAIESQSEHPLAQAIVRHADRLGIHPAPASNFQSIPGRGATAVLEGRKVWIGSSHQLLESHLPTFPNGQTVTVPKELDQFSIVVVGNEEHVCGLIALGDSVRSNAQSTVTKLHRLGISQVALLTGDNTAAARTIGLQAGIDDVRAQLLPEEKVTAVEQLVRDHGVTAMVGDGVNDAPAMAGASFGIAMGHVGTDAALETADIVLIDDDVSRIPWLVQHARSMLQIIRQNICASLVVKAAFAALTVVGYASLWAAIAADTGVSLLVVVNALRLLVTKSIRRDSNGQPSQAPNPA
jgi:Cd2+/Zn2+-exporting ATPase